MSTMKRNAIDRLLAFETKIHWYRTPTPGIRFVRVHQWSHPQKPRQVEYGGCEVLGYGETVEGNVSRVFYVRVDETPDGLPDGCGAFFVCKNFRGEPTEPSLIKPRTPLQMPLLTSCTEAVIQAELLARADFASYWRGVAKQRELSALAKQKHDAEVASLAAAAVAAIPKPKRKWWQFG